MIKRILLVHGVLNARWWLLPLALRLRQEGFATQLFGYASVTGGPRKALPELRERLSSGGFDAAVGHSLGGLLLLEALRDLPQSVLRRAVCLGSPLQGSAAAARLAQTAWGRAVLGRSAEFLERGVMPWNGKAEVGMIAGDRARGAGRLFVRFDASSDGTVAVDETRLPGLADHCIVHASHTGLVFSRDTARQASRFLREGRFRHATKDKVV